MRPERVGVLVRDGPVGAGPRVGLGRGRGRERGHGEAVDLQRERSSRIPLVFEWRDARQQAFELGGGDLGRRADKEQARLAERGWCGDAVGVDEGEGGGGQEGRLDDAAEVLDVDWVGGRREGGAEGGEDGVGGAGGELEGVDGDCEIVSLRVWKEGVFWRCNDVLSSLLARISPLVFSGSRRPLRGVMPRLCTSASWGLPSALCCVLMTYCWRKSVRCGQG